MDPTDITPFLTSDQYESVLQMIQSQNPSVELQPRSTRRKRSAAPETDRRQNLRRRLTQPNYIVPGPEDDDYDCDSSEDSPLTAAQPNENIVNQPTITLDGSLDTVPSPASQINKNTTTKPPTITSATSSPNVGPSPASQTNENTAIEPLMPSGPVASPMAPQTKTATRGPGIDSEAEYERRQLIVSARFRSVMAEDEFLKTHKRNQDAQKMTTLLAINEADTKEREDALTATLTGPYTVLDYQLDELRGMKERCDDSIREAEIKMGELPEMKERSKRLAEFIDFAEQKLQRREKFPDGESEKKPEERNDGDDGGNDGNSATKDDKDDGEAGKTSPSEDEDNGKIEGMNCTKDDGDSDEYESDDDFVVDDSEDDEDGDDDDYEDGCSDKSESEHYVANAIVFPMEENIYSRDANMGQ